MEEFATRRPMSNEAVLLQAFDHLNAGNIDGCLHLITKDFIINIAEMPFPKRGHTAWREHADYLLSAIPDVRIDVQDTIAAGDKVAVRIRIKGTHRGEFLGAAPTGGVIEYESHEIYRFEGGKIAEEWICSDNITLMTQIGVLSRGHLISMWLSGYRFWAGLATGAALFAILHALCVRSLRLR